jgi:excisionase family DNA binding protein
MTKINQVALIQIPNQRLFGTKAAARYVGMHEQTLRKLTDEGVISSRRLGCRRVYLLEDL